MGQNNKEVLRIMEEFSKKKQREYKNTFTARELREELGMGEKKIHNLIRNLVYEGKLKVVKIKMINIAGVEYPTVGYQILKPKKKKK